MSLDDHCQICGQQAVPINLCPFSTCPMRLCDACLVFHEVDHEDESDDICDECGANYQECQCGEDPDAT